MNTYVTNGILNCDGNWDNIDSLIIKIIDNPDGITKQYRGSGKNQYFSQWPCSGEIESKRNKTREIPKQVIKWQTK